MSVFDVISNIIMSFSANQIYDFSKNTIEEKRLKCFQEDIEKWVREYINNHDGTVLTTGDFESFLKNHKLIEDIFGQISSAKSKVSKEEYIKEKIRLFHEVQSNTKKNQYDTDDVLRDFISWLYDKIDLFFREKLSSNENYIVSRNENSNQQLNNEIQELKNISQDGSYKLDEIKNLIQNGSKIADKNEIWEIYKTLSDMITYGRVSEVLPIYSLLKGKSEDLEHSISFLLKLFSNADNINADFDKLQRSIEDDKIYCDICRIAIYVNKWRENYDELKKVSDRNTNLYKIAQSLLNYNSKDFYSIDRREEECIVHFDYKISNNYPDEEWLVNRIALLDILEQQFSNTSEIIKKIIGDSKNILDKFIFLRQRILEAYSNIEVRSDFAKKLYTDAYELVCISDRLAIDFKCKIYEMFLRTTLFISDEEFEKVAKIVPKELYGNKDIDFLILESELRSETLKIDDLISTCMKHEEYWPFNNYLVKYSNSNPLEMKDLIEKYKFVIEIDPSIFLIYVNLINDVDGIDKAIEILIRYEDQYSEYLEFWLTKLSIRYVDDEMSFVIKKYKNGEFKFLSNNVNYVFVEALIKNFKYKDAIEIIKRIEIIENLPPDYRRLKAIALCCTKREIEALSIFNDIFESGNHNDEIIYYILMLSYRNRRTVSELVLFYAEKSDNPTILLYLAAIYAMENKLIEASSINLKAMLRTTDSKSDVFTQRLGFEIFNKNLDEIEIKGIDVDTVVYLKSEDGTIKKTYAIYSQDVLPEEPYKWEGIENIYKENAIKLGLFRKKYGDKIYLEDKLFLVEDIESLDTFLFRLSMSKAIENGQVKELSILLNDNEEIDGEELIKSLKNVVGDSKKKMFWLDRYKDLSQIPISFYLSLQCVRVTFFELVSDLCMNKSILYREANNSIDLIECDYIFSYTSLVVLYRLGWKCSNNKYSYVIPKVTEKIIFEEIEEIIRKNNRDDVSFLGVYDDNLYLNEETEENKNQYMDEAVTFKAYIEGFEVIDNCSDLHIENKYIDLIQKLLGIADYDAIIIAKDTGRILVSGEVITSAIPEILNIDVKTIGIADFLTKESSSVEELLDYIRKMMEYRFTVPFTSNTIYKIIEFFNESNEDEKKYILERWIEILELPMQDNGYKEVMAAHVRECILSIKENNVRVTIILECLLLSWLKYTGQKYVIGLNNEGKIFTKIVNDKDEE